MLFRKSELITYRYFLKSISRLWIIPLVIINVIVPVISYLLYRSMGENASMYILDVLFITLPVSSVWTSTFVSELFFSDKARDILFFYDIKKRFAVSVKFYSFFAVNAIMAVLLHFKCIYDPFGFAVKIFCVSVLFYGIAAFVLRVSKSATMAVLILMLYILLNEFIFSDFFIFYKNYGVLTLNVFLLKYLFLLLIAAVLIFMSFKKL